MVVTITTKNAMKILKNDGWYVSRQRGSHIQMKHPKKKGIVTLVVGQNPIPIGTLKSIERQSGLKF